MDARLQDWHMTIGDYAKVIMSILIYSTGVSTIMYDQETINGFLLNSEINVDRFPENYVKNNSFNSPTTLTSELNVALLL